MCWRMAIVYFTAPHDCRHGCNAEFHARTSCPAIPYAAGANVRGAALAIPPKCKYNRGIETR